MCTSMIRTSTFMMMKVVNTNLEVRQDNSNATTKCNPSTLSISLRAVSLIA